MCGIVGINSFENVVPRIMDGLSRLEYRGYDSAGIATIDHGQFQVRRAVGKLQSLRDLLQHHPVQGNVGIAHTRWATHGVPNQTNAHPHSNEYVAVVHNGIIENHAELRAGLQQKGYVFNSQTDTEVVVHLFTDYLKQGKTPLECLQSLLGDIVGAFALAIILRQFPDLMLVARKGSPLVIGIGKDEMYIGSDALALSDWTNQVIYLEDGDYAELTAKSYQIYDVAHQAISRPIKVVEFKADAVAKGSYAHFMQKEIFEQPMVIGKTLQQYVDSEALATKLSTTADWMAAPKLSIVACGTSYYAGMVAKYWFETYAKISVEVDIASEFRYRDPVFLEEGITLVISQSGETIDTLMALTLAAEKGQQTVAIVNVPESSIARTAQDVLLTYAGPEIGVASTKAFTAQLTVLANLVIYAAKQRGHLTQSQEKALVTELMTAPGLVMTALQTETDIHQVALVLEKAQDVLFLGRGTNFPVALEGALKLKEISYIHAEGYAAGELKHGPIALIDNTVPVVVNIPATDVWFEKTLSNVQEVAARGAKTICLTDAKGQKALEANHIDSLVLKMPTCSSFVAPIVYAVPMQLLAYHTAVLRGTDVDQPRNLAKSVTVE
ncbi:glutamine--fructose-6-phosphate transaminase (isomerizing) [Candidatus Paracaedibacter symbiosus]|uniref:glutamine--fructose-6-phosphate transaminase (isomerizing) n=1 Tax=Candidatus Paracaedibacter symbiosus TaxID=244582 RepID=UPI00050959D9|nr:glutamine--fructose-6-phosphate transaminase (isomerizing) [Candidatus Paracaedibacter symbiosus]